MLLSEYLFKVWPIYIPPLSAGLLSKYNKRTWASIARDSNADSTLHINEIHPLQMPIEIEKYLLQVHFLKLLSGIKLQSVS